MHPCICSSIISAVVQQMIMKGSDSSGCSSFARVEGRAPQPSLYPPHHLPDNQHQKGQEGFIWLVSEEEFKFSYSTRRKHNVRAGSEISPSGSFEGGDKMLSGGGKWRGRGTFMGLSLSVAEAHSGCVCPGSTQLTNGAVQHVVPGVWSQVLVLMLRPQQHLLGAVPASSQTSAPVSALSQSDTEVFAIKPSCRIQRISYKNINPGINLTLKALEMQSNLFVDQKQ